MIDFNKYNQTIFAVKIQCFIDPNLLKDHIEL